MFRRDLWRYRHFRDDVLDLPRYQLEREMQLKRAPTFDTKDSLMSEVMMLDFPTPSDHVSLVHCM